MLMIGAANGFIIGIYMRTVHISINKKFVKDTMGLFGPFLLSAFLGSFVVVPSALIYFYNNDTEVPGLGTKVPSYLAGWQLVYVGISAGIGLGGGIFTGLMCICDKDRYGLAHNHRYFDNDYGLWEPS